MKHVLHFLFSLLCCLAVSPVVQADDCHLLPRPQKFTRSAKSFHSETVKISTPVLQGEWEDFVTERGGKVNERANALIEVKLVPSIEKAV
ncbi:MAG: beta-N-acetylhexosaminidase, partial [Bacteroides sp.]|nr:beta-N-acetylhexosaminidase [Bacteroides sp.]